ncbi:hypothetical protein BV898_09067 [Hypsibius exemplaris]|uniref:Uncharacterized protein n=1 Tax=Hypsibius exemplaris TaxID=2072580 RepID=A0A1W0WP20_HYPEX|nr:hypothetical protein BV898_09067 [Hypsibius exemplaris]
MEECSYPDGVAKALQTRLIDHRIVRVLEAQTERCEEGVQQILNIGRTCSLVLGGCEGRLDVADILHQHFGRLADLDHLRVIRSFSAVFGLKAAWFGCLGFGGAPSSS